MISDGLLHILYIEDDEDDFFIMRDMLADINPDKYVLEWCNRPAESISKLNSNHFDLCFLDYRLGSVDGLTILKDIKAQGLDLPVIMLTSQVREDIDREAMQAGAIDYLVKGRISINALERIIRYAISNKNAEKARRETETLQQTKDLAAAVAHEFAQPLQALSNYHELMSNGVLKKEYIEKIGLQIRRIHELTNNLRNITGLKKKDYVDTQILDIEMSSNDQKFIVGNKILIVDDEEIILETLVDMFQLKGLTVDSASNGEDALELIRDNEYEIIISDVMMDGMSGPQLFEKVRAMGNTSTFIFITGYEISDSLKKIVSQADGVLSKPVSMEEFFQTFNSVQDRCII